jgi:hypothetical protein
MISRKWRGKEVYKSGKVEDGKVKWWRRTDDPILSLDHLLISSYLIVNPEGDIPCAATANFLPSRLQAVEKPASVAPTYQPP